MCLFLVTFVLLFASCGGFLIDGMTTHPPNSGSGITDNHYFTLVSLIAQEKQQRENDMIQMKQKLLENERKVSVLELTVDRINAGNDTVDKADFEKATNDVMQKYQTLEGSYKTLQQNFIELQQNHVNLIDENNKLKIKINSSELEMEQMKYELNGLKSLNSNNLSNEIQSLKIDNALVKQQLQNTNNKVNRLESIQQARGEDLLALYNQTMNVKSQLQTTNNRINGLVSIQESRGQDIIAVHNQTMNMITRIQDLDREQNKTTQLLIDEVKKTEIVNEHNLQQIQKNQNETVMEIRQSIYNISTEQHSLKNMMKYVQQTTNRTIEETNKLISDGSKKAAVTACANGGSYKSRKPIPFSNVSTSYVMTNLSTLTTNGLFTCESDGLYIVFVTIVSNQKDGYFYIDKNNNDLVSVYLQSKETEYWYSGSNTAVVLMSVKDTISVRPYYDNSYVLGSPFSCITVVKVK